MTVPSIKKFNLIWNEHQFDSTKNGNKNRLYIEYNTAEAFQTHQAFNWLMIAMNSDSDIVYVGQHETGVERQHEAYTSQIKHTAILQRQGILFKDESLNEIKGSLRDIFNNHDFFVISVDKLAVIEEMDERIYKIISKKQVEKAIDFEMLEDWALNYLGKKHKQENKEEADKGRTVINEFKKLGEYILEDFSSFELASCAKWQNSGNIRPYLWIQFKDKEQINNPCSISLFVIKENNSMKLALETEIDDSKAKDVDYEMFRKTLEVSIENKQDLGWGNQV